MSYKSEFPDFDHELPELSGWNDKSWHNNEMPHLLREIETEVGTVYGFLWVNYLSREKRESPDGAVYVLDVYSKNMHYVGTIAEGDTIQELKSSIDAWRMKAVGSKEIWGEKTDGDIFADACEMYAYHSLDRTNEKMDDRQHDSRTLLDKETIDKVSQVGELLIRAMAIIGTLSKEQQDELRNATHGNLPDALVFPLRGAKELSHQTRESLKTHPPKGIENFVI